MTNRKKEISNQNHKEEELVMRKVQPQPKGQEEHLNPKDHQEVQQVKRNGDNTFEEKKQKLQDETQDFMYQQSSKFSSVSRNLVLGIT